MSRKSGFWRDTPRALPPRCQRSLTLSAKAPACIRLSRELNCVMTLRLTPPASSEWSMARCSPTERPYGPRHLAHARAASSVSDPKPSGHCPISASRGLLRGRQVALGGTFRNKVRILERLCRSSRRALLRLWSRGSGFRKTSMPSLWCGNIVNALLQTTRYLSVMRLVPPKPWRRRTPNVRPPSPPFSKTRSWKTSAIVYGLLLFPKCYDLTSCETASF